MHVVWVCGEHPLPRGTQIGLGSAVCSLALSERPLAAWPAPPDWTISKISKTFQNVSKTLKIFQACSCAFGCSIALSRPQMIRDGRPRPSEGPFLPSANLRHGAVSPLKFRSWPMREPTLEHAARITRHVPRCISRHLAPPYSAEYPQLPTSLGSRANAKTMASYFITLVLQSVRTSLSKGRWGQRWHWSQCSTLATRT